MKGSTGADLQQLLSASEVLEGMPWVLMTAQAMSCVGKTVKSALVHEALPEGAGAETTEDIVGWKYKEVLTGRKYQGPFSILLVRLSSCLFTKVSCSTGSVECNRKCCPQSCADQINPNAKRI